MKHNTLHITKRGAIEFILIALIVVARLIPHLANFTPVLAVWTYYGRRGARPWLLVAAVLATDIALGLAGVLVWVWLAYGAIWLISRHLSWWQRGIGAAFIFFLISNFGVYLAGWYDSLWACYLAALPFFMRTLVSTLGYCGAIEVLERVGVLEHGALRRHYAHARA